MRRPSLLVALLIGVVAAVLVVGPGRFHTGAQGGTPTAAGPGFVGAWRVTVTQPGRPPSPALATFGADGTLLVANPPAIPAPPGAPAKVIFNSGGQGAWAASGAGSAAFTFLLLNTNEAGAFIGTVTVRAQAALDATGNAFSGRYTEAVAGAHGQPVASGAGTITGTRIVVAPLSTSPAGTPAS